MARNNKALALREIGVDDDALKRTATEERGFLLDAEGKVTPIRRRTSVFIILRDSGSLTPNQSAAAVRLMWIYATMRGIQGLPDEDLQRIRPHDEDRGNPDLVYIGLVKARGANWAKGEYDRILNRVGPLSAALLDTLFYDFLECDHEPPVRNANGKVQPRWRLKVKEFFKKRGRVVTLPNEENLAVWIACEELQRVMT